MKRAVKLQAPLKDNVVPVLLVYYRGGFISVKLALICRCCLLSEGVTLGASNVGVIYGDPSHKTEFPLSWGGSDMVSS